MPFYAVAIGRKPGVYNTWDECKSQVEKFPNARYKKFNTMDEAKQFCQARKSTGNNRPVNDKQSSIIGQNVVSSSHPTTAAVSSRKRKLDESLEPSTSTSSTNFKFSKSSFAEAGSKSDYSDTVIVYTDGACIANGKSGARAGIGVYWGEGHVDNVSEPLPGRPTNNRAEIQAVVTALNQAKSRGHKSITIRTDSKFLLQSITLWVGKWIKNNWTLSTGGPVKNKEDFQDLMRAAEGIHVQWEKVRGHSGHHGNEKADQLAREGVSKHARK